MLNNLSQYLKKFSAAVPKDKIIKEALQEIIKDEVGYGDLKKTDIRIQNTIAWISAPGVVKHAITLKKQSVLAKLQEQLPDNISIRDIQ